MTSPTVPATFARKPVLDTVFGDLWPDAQAKGHPRLVAAALAVGGLGAVVVPFRGPGLAMFLTFASVCGVVAVADRRFVMPSHAGAALLCLLLTATVVVRDAAWIVVLCLLAAFAVGATTLSGGRSVPGMLASGAAIPLAGVRGLPWLGRSLSAGGMPARWWPLVRTVGLSALLVLVFGALFASADALFASWVGVLVPDLRVETLLVRGFVGAAVAGPTLAGVYVALTTPRVERLALPAGRPVTRRFEWLVPVGLVLVTFTVFLAAQLTALFGGHDYLRRTTGLTYADYVHQGFGQLTCATVLTLAVIAAAMRKASRESAVDRLLLRVMLGVLCGLTLVVVASALSRMHLYEEAYGFTRLRLLVSVFEGWLGLVVVLVLLAGLTLRGPWVPRASVLAGAGMLLVLAALNPDAYIAERNIERFEQTGKIDWYYLSALSADAAPALTRLPEDIRHCATTGIEVQQDDDWLEWNLGRWRAARALGPVELDASAGCARG